MKVGVFSFTTGARPGYNDYMEQFYHGVKKHTPDAFFEKDYKYSECDVAVIFGSCRIEKTKAGYHMFKKEIIHDRPCRVVYIESCLLGRVARVPMNKHWRVGVDHFMLHEGNFGFRKNPPSDRWNDLNIELKPWKTDGDYSLVCMQLLKDASLLGTNHRQWAQDVVNELLDKTDKDVVVRIHPLTKHKDHSRMINMNVFKHKRVHLSMENTLEEDLENAFCAVSFSSGSGVDAVIAGVPHIACSPASMVYPLSGNSFNQVNNIPTPDRLTHMKNLAYAQWTPDEMESGECWEHLLNNVFSS